MIGEAIEPQQVVGGRLADLYRDHPPAARRLAYLLTGDRWAADEVVQDAFVRIAVIDGKSGRALKRINTVAGVFDVLVVDKTLWTSVQLHGIYWTRT